MSILFGFAGTAGAEVLSPPTNIPFAKDVIIDKYVRGQPLKLFTYTGKWQVKAVGKRLAMVGTSDKNGLYILSIDKLTDKPKSLKIDFELIDVNKEYGFIYGDVGVVVVNNRMFPAKFDDKTKVLNATSTNSKAFNITKGKINSLAINTGYDPTGGPNQVCVIYINGVGLQLDCPNGDSSFGVYLNSKNGITISSIRWGIGSK